jgi:HlyD family secretion protein
MHMTSKYFSRWLSIFIVLAIAAVAIFSWQYFHRPKAPESFASGNGRIEATSVNIATKTSGRLSDILVREGDDVVTGQVLAHMDTATLVADLHEAVAQVKRARSAKEIAQANVAQRKSEKSAANALIAQRESELALTDKDLQRTQQLIDKGFVSPQKLDVDKSRKGSAAASARAARSQQNEVQSSISAALAAVNEAQSAIEAAEAKVEKIKADINDAALTAPVSGRVLYRLAEPGEVLGAGGNVVTLLDITDVYMTIFLPTSQVGRIAIGTDARIVLDVRPDISIPATITFVSPEAQFTPKSVETRTEREKLMFRVKVKIPEALLKAHAKRVKTGLPGVAYVRLDANAPWPDTLPPLVDDKNAR